MDASVFVRTRNRKQASDKHNILLLLIFPARLQWNPTLPGDKGSRGTPPSPWVNKDGKNSIRPAGVPRDKRCQTSTQLKHILRDSFIIQSKTIGRIIRRSFQREVSGPTAQIKPGGCRFICYRTQLGLKKTCQQLHNEQLKNNKKNKKQNKKD